MIYKGTRNITGLFFGGHVINAVYKGARLVWSGVRSCFGSGKWLDERPWLDGDLWKD
jgi:hypothetical protein